MKARLLCALAFGLFATARSFAHHSTAPIYLMDQEIGIEGVVTQFRFINPHARIYLDVTNAAGEVERWMAEGGTPIVLLRLGWNGQEIKAGDKVKIHGNPTRDGSRVIHWVTITLPDGTELFGEDIDFGAIDRRRRQP